MNVMNREILVDRKSLKLKGRFRARIVDSKTGRVKRDCGWQDNLILNSGFESIQSDYFVEMFEYGVCGTGTTPTQLDSGTQTISQSGTSVTLSVGAFEFSASHIGDILKWDSGETARITAYVGPLSVTVDTNATVAADEFTIYYASQSTMATETKRSNTYLTGAGNTETTFNWTTGVISNRRTYDFSIETGSVTYTEVGTAKLSSGAPLFSRILLAAPLNLVSGDQLRLTYELNIALTPYTVTSTTITITGWGALTGSVQNEHFGLRYVNSAGGTSGSTYAMNEPQVVGRGFISDSTTALSTNPSTGTNPPTNRNGTSWATKAGSNAFTGAGTLTMKVTKTAVFGTSEGNITGVRSICLAGNSSSTNYIVHAFLLDSGQNKLNTHTLTLNWEITWTRQI